MQNHLREYIHSERVRQGLSLADLSWRIGYANITKGMNRLCRFEREGLIRDELLDRIIETLGLHRAFIRELDALDDQEEVVAFDEWVKQPVPMTLYAKVIPGVYHSRRIPPNAKTERGAIDFAASFARENGWPVCLCLSRRTSIWFDAEGKILFRSEAKPDHVNHPYMTLG